VFDKRQYFPSLVLCSLYLQTSKTKTEKQILPKSLKPGSSNNVKPFAPVISLVTADINLFQGQFQINCFGIFFCWIRLCGALPTCSKGDSQKIHDFALNRWAVQSHPHFCAASKQVSSAYTLVPLASHSSLSKQPCYNCVADAPSLGAGLQCLGAHIKHTHGNGSEAK